MAWKVVLYFSNRASICSHAFIFLSPTRWFVMVGWRISISLQTFVQLQLFDQTRLDCRLCCCTSIVSTLCFKHVWIMVLCLGTNICFLILWSNTFGLWFSVVYKHQSSPVFQSHFVFLVCAHHQSTATCLKHFDFGFLFVHPPTHTQLRVAREEFTSGQSSEATVNFLGEDRKRDQTGQ